MVKNYVQIGTEAHQLIEQCLNSDPSLVDKLCERGMGEVINIPIDKLCEELKDITITEPKYYARDSGNKQREHYANLARYMK